MKPILIFFLFCFQTGFTQVTQVRDTILMGSRFKLTVVAPSNLEATHSINLAIAEIVRIEELISDWKPHSQLSKINQNAGITPVEVDKELVDLIIRAKKYSENTQGAFDISFAAMEKIWKFDDSMETLPTPSEIAHAIRNVGYQNIQVNAQNNTVFLTKKGMKLGFGSIGKGYAADRAVQVLKSLHIPAALVDASGDLAFYGHPKPNTNWIIGITNPVKNNKIISKLNLTNAAVTTSGDYQKYVYIGNTRYAHIINPKTGWPSTGLTSVTVIGPNAEFANACSTSIMVLGLKEGKEFINKHPEYAALFITNSGKKYESKNYKKVLKKYKK